MKVIDGDVHYRWRRPQDLAPYLAEPWRSRLLGGQVLYPPVLYYNIAGVRRRDATPPGGGQAGSDPDFLIHDLVDRYDLDFAVLTGEGGHLGVSNLPDPDWATALAGAYNQWLAEEWFPRDPRFVGSILVALQDPHGAAREIDRCAAHPQFAQVVVGTGARFPYGQRFYDPIWEAATRHGLPVAIHPGNDGCGTAPSPTPAGYPAHYIEWHTLLPLAFQAHLTSLLCEGVFARFPGLRVILVEGGFAWLPGLLWRLDKNWRGLRAEVPWVKRPPSEYLVEHVRFTTQPMEEPPAPQHLRALFDMLPFEDLLLFASDYPHWDFDDPRTAFLGQPEAFRRKVLSENARAVYRLPRETTAAPPRSGSS